MRQLRQNRPQTQAGGEKAFLKFLLATLSESNGGMNVLDKVLNLDLILPQVPENGRILPRVFSPGPKR